MSPSLCKNQPNHVTWISYSLLLEKKPDLKAYRAAKEMSAFRKCDSRRSETQTTALHPFFHLNHTCHSAMVWILWRGTHADRPRSSHGPGTAASDHPRVAGSIWLLPVPTGGSLFLERGRARLSVTVSLLPSGDPTTLPAVLQSEGVTHTVVALIDSRAEGYFMDIDLARH